MNHNTICIFVVLYDDQKNFEILKLHQRTNYFFLIIVS